MMERSGEEYLLPASKPLTDELENDRKCFENKDTANERQNSNLVNHKRNHSKDTTKSERTCIPHKEKSRRHILTQKCCNSPNSDCAERCQNVQTIEKRYHA